MLNDEITVLIKYISKIKISDIENDEDCVDLKRALHALKRQLIES